MDNSPRQLIISLFGLYARDEGNGLSVRGLIALMADLGVDSAAVRSSVSRLKKRGILESHDYDNKAGYALSKSALEVLRAGDERIWHRRRAAVSDGWLVVIFSVPEIERNRRYALRTLLAQLGFGVAAPGVWVAPGTLYEETQEALRRRELEGYTQIFVRAALVSDNISSQIEAWWNLDSLCSKYVDFIERYGEVYDYSEVKTWDDYQQAFRIYLQMLTFWRRLPYLDPGWPREYLPEDWPGSEAAKIFFGLDHLLRGPAEMHARKRYSAGK